MAFSSKFGNIVKQITSKHVNLDFSVPNPSFFQMIRCMSSSKLFIGGLSYTTDDPSLREVFSQYGEVLDARVIVDRETCRSRGFGFVTFSSSEAATSAIQAVDGQDVHGRRVRVDYATDRSRSFGGGGGGYGGGYSGGGGGYNGRGTFGDSGVGARNLDIGGGSDGADYDTGDFAGGDSATDTGAEALVVEENERDGDSDRPDNYAGTRI